MRSPEVRERFRTLFVIGVISVLFSSTSVHSAPAYEHYDKCAQSYSSYIDIAICGKRNRNLACKKKRSCSKEGNDFVLYADTLSVGVKDGEITNFEARLMLADYKQRLKDRLAKERAEIERRLIERGTPKRLF